MNFFNIAFILIIATFITLTHGIPIVRPSPVNNRFREVDNDSHNRINEHLYSTCILPLRDGGGYPSTTGNPSGGGRWND